MSAPSPKELRRALDKWGVNYRLMNDWDSERIDPYGESFSPVGVVLHHTAGVDSLQYCMRGSFPPVRNCHFLVGRDGVVYVLAGGGCYHAGLGGPLRIDGNLVTDGNRKLYGIEIESLGTKAHVDARENERDGMTPAQVESVALLSNALLDAMDKPGHFDAVIRHRDWAPNRKVDVLQPIKWWRDQIRDAFRASGPTKPPVVKPETVEKPKPPKPVAPKPVDPPKKPTPPRPLVVAIRFRNVKPGLTNNHILIVQKALAREFPGFDYSSGPGTFGPRTREAYAKWQHRQGWRGEDADGVPGLESLKALAKRHGFLVVE